MKLKLFSFLTVASFEGYLNEERAVCAVNSQNVEPDTGMFEY